jgi:hypothetical protein
MACCLPSPGGCCYWSSKLLTEGSPRGKDTLFPSDWIDSTLVGGRGLRLAYQTSMWLAAGSGSGHGLRT